MPVNFKFVFKMENNYSYEELADMHLVYGAALCNGRDAARLYEERYPERRQPHHTTFASIHRRLRETGTLRHPGGTGRPRTARTVEFEEEVLHCVEENQSTSVRAIAHHMGSSRMAVHRVLQEQLLYPFHLQRVQVLYPEDSPHRLAFCQWFLNHNEPDFGSILFSDEACFTRDGYFNSRNSHIWHDENPHAVAPRRHQQQFSVNMWAGILGENIIVYLLPARLSANIYLDFLQNILPLLLQNIPLNLRNNMWFQHDGAPPHFGVNVRQYLDQRFPQRWIGRGGPVAWPARSPDLNPLDFFLWGYLKSLVYETPVRNEEDLLAKIMASCTHVEAIPGIFQRVRESMTRRCNLCIEANGQHFEQLL